MRQLPIQRSGERIPGGMMIVPVVAAAVVPLSGVRGGPDALGRERARAALWALAPKA
jgi:hypothetical protein